MARLAGALRGTVGEVVCRGGNVMLGYRGRAEEVRAHVNTRIAGYKAPREVEFVTELPLSPAGKVLKRELRRVSRSRMRAEGGEA